MPEEVRQSSRTGRPGFALGAAPGDAVYTGPPRAFDPELRVLCYGPEGVDEVELGDVPEDDDSVCWVDLRGIHNVLTVQQVTSAFRLHPLIVEDIVAPGQRVRIDEQDDQMVIRARVVGLEEEEAEQVTLVLGPGFVLTFREFSDHLFDGVRQRLVQGHGRLRRRDASYLAYALLDSVVDDFARAQLQLEDRLVDLEEKVVEVDTPDPEFPEEMHALRGQLMRVRRAVSPLAEEIGNLIRREHPMISPIVRPYYRDLQDHLLHVKESLAIARETSRNLQDLHTSQVSQKMNGDMRVLTGVATVFIPLTFLAGVYGMNFRYIPELSWRFAYPAFWGACLLISAGLVVFFRRRGWF